MSSDVKPGWVLVDGMLHEVSEFADMQERPLASCPVCKRVVILKLGKIRVHHYAHHANDICIVTQSETALHLNTKFYIYNQLLNASVLYVEQKCKGYTSCDRSKQLVWLRDWDDVQLEYTIGIYRADIAILFKKQVVGVIEIHATHLTEEPKIEYFKENGIRWVEVEACESIYEGDEKWNPSTPFPRSNYYPKPDKWVCSRCQERRREDARRLEQDEKRREYEKHNYKKIHAAKMVDFYFGSGKKYREVYYVMEKVKDGEWISAWVKTENNEILASEKYPITKESLSRLNQAVNQNINRHKEVAIIDVVRGWNPWTPGNKFVARNIQRDPFRYTWSTKDRRWSKYEVKPVISIKHEINLEPNQLITDASIRRYNEKRSVQKKIKPVFNEDWEFGTCRFCGKVTRDYWERDGKTGLCSCRTCRREGRQ